MLQFYVDQILSRDGEKNLSYCILGPDDLVRSVSIGLVMLREEDHVPVDL